MVFIKTSYNHILNKPDAVLCLINQDKDTIMDNKLRYYKSWSEKDFSIFNRRINYKHVT
jgi:hypothetical protein